MKIISYTFFFYLVFAIWQWKFNPEDWSTSARAWSVGLLAGSILLEAILDLILAIIKAKTELLKKETDQLVIKGSKLQGYIAKQLQQAEEARKKSHDEFIEQRNARKGQ